MNIKELIKEAHENATERGFYDCPECQGEGFFPIAQGNDTVKCIICNGTGIDPNKNIGELLMLIVSELGEALEAHRNNRFSDRIKDSPYYMIYLNEWSGPGFKMLPATSRLFEQTIKDTFEDEIADVFIRLFDLCGYLGIEPEIVHFSVIDRTVTNVSEMLFIITKEIVKISDHHQGVSIESSLDSLDSLCQKHNIPIEKHIKAKMAYNRTRPHKHNKEY